MIAAALLALLVQAPPQEPKRPDDPVQDAVPVPSRWRLPFPDYFLHEPGRWLDPYRQNVLKGDYPVLGEDLFLSITGRSDTTVELRRLPVPSGVSTAGAGSSTFFGEGEQLLVVQDLVASFEFYRGDTSFRPRDFEIRVTGALNYNYVKTRENALVSPDVREGTARQDHFAALQEALVEAHLLDVSATYDFIAARAGIQPFVGDFRGLLFRDTNLGARLFGTLLSNRVQWNLAAFHPLEKDTHSELNTFHSRDQWIGVANVYVQDFLWDGYTAQASLHVSRDDGGTEYDDDHFLVRPGVIGTVRTHDVDVTYLGWAGDGHVGRLNVSHALYWAVGRDEFNPLAGRPLDLSAWLAAVEGSTDIDWARVRLSFLWASGDSDPFDSKGEGFDSIFEGADWAGGPFSFWNRQAIKLQGVDLVNRNSQLATLRTSKSQGQVNFVNPGLFLYNAGLDVDLLPEVKLVLNANWIRFQDTESLKVFTQQAGIRGDVGWDFGLGLVARPFLNNNLVATVGGAAFLPGRGFTDLYDSRQTLYSVFAQLTLVY